ncbi:acetyl-CoA carboxylase biotin carboxyl carrier protein [Sphingomonas lutea]|uniref:Biotin carboxyl carrier protein of acetyl-CoA carboxylase n=1 Tax=Sphingomonas lutea TaxID=1045317 RepID=A0A7G9SJG4_9SPHN|nr:acetyl-CoA carboxylase biotin carboxyl carrier protein [Sphingomonas lutea]QNN67989.1 acetyl-CoA carboxylase biotin carboxyl carrier protein [Sphingomonas lutea]
MAESAKGEKNGGMRIEPALVRELARLLTENELTEIEVEDGDRKIKVKREPAAVVSAAAAPAAAAPAPAPVAANATEPAAPAAAPEDIGGTPVKSPMVGTAFLSPQPGAEPFVAVGDTVKAGDTLLIVEAMKVMNPITAPAAGVVKKLMVSDGQPVEFDQPLAVIG